MKTILLILGLFLPLLCSAEEERVTYSFSSTVRSQYLDEGGIRLADTVIQSEIIVSLQNGLYFYLWGSQDLNGPKDSFGNEIELGLGWEGDISEKLTLNVQFGYVDEPLVGTFDHIDSLYAHVKLSRSLKNDWVVSALWEHFHCEAFTGGNHVGVEISRDFAINDKWTVPLSIAVLYGDGVFDAKPGCFLRGNVGLEYKLKESLTLRAGCDFFLFPDDLDFRKDDAAFYAGFEFEF